MTWNDMLEPSNIRIPLLFFSALALLVTNFVKSIRAGEIPCVKSTLHFVIKEANQKAIESAVIIYQDVMDNVDLPTEDENATLFIANSKAVGLAVKTFQDNKFEDATGAFQAEFMVCTQTLFKKSICSCLHDLARSMNWRIAVHIHEI